LGEVGTVKIVFERNKERAEAYKGRVEETELFMEYRAATLAGWVPSTENLPTQNGDRRLTGRVSDPNARSITKRKEQGACESSGTYNGRAT